MTSLDDLYSNFGSLSLNAPLDRVSTLSWISRYTLVHDEVLPSISRSRTRRRLQRSDPFFRRSRDVFDSIRSRLGLTEQSFFNFEDLACGDLRLPVILLMEPTSSQEQPYERMIDRTPTLQYLRDNFLDYLHLDLEDVVVIDVYPFLEANKPHGMRERDRADLQDAVLSITSDFLNTFQPDVVVSCQCKSGYSERERSSPHAALAAILRSSMEGARRKRVRPFRLNGGDVINMVQAFHPSSFINFGDDDDDRERLQKDWEAILDDVFSPFENWPQSSAVRSSAPPASSYIQPFPPKAPQVSYYESPYTAPASYYVPPPPAPQASYYKPNYTAPVSRYVLPPPPPAPLLSSPPPKHGGAFSSLKSLFSHNKDGQGKLKKRSW